MRIKCPECHSVLEVKQPRPGRYQPVCTDCGKSFRFQITDGNPGKVRIGRMDPVATAKAEPATVAATNSMTQEVDEGIRTFESSFASDEIPERLGGYRILRLLGRGAMGSVYEAKQLSLDRLVALKTIRQRLAGNAASLARFTREAYAAAQLTHHNVVQIYDFGEDDGHHYFSMEWVRGGPLNDLIRDKGAIDPKLAAGYILQAAARVAIRAPARNGSSRCEARQSATEQ